MKRVVKRIVSLTLAVAIMVACFVFAPVLSASAAETVAITAITNEIDSETFSVDVNITSNPGIVSLRLFVEYDTNVVTLTGAEDKGVLGTSQFTDTFKSPFAMVWSNGTATENITFTGTIASLTFKVNEGVEDETVTTISLSTKTANDVLSVDPETLDLVQVTPNITNATWKYEAPDALSYGLNDSDLTASITACDKNATEVVVPETVTKDGVTYTVTSIGSSAFKNCKKLVSVTLPDTVTAISSFAFTYCTALKEIDLGNSLKTIAMSAFYECSALEEIIMPDTVSGIGSTAFTKCYSLKNVVIGKKVANIPQSAFYGCKALKSVTFGPDLKTIAYYAFAGCNAITDVYYGNNEGTKKTIAINSSNTAVLNANWHYTDIEFLTYTYDETKMTATVTSCDKKAVSVTIPATVTKGGKTYKVTAIGDNAFYSNTKLLEVFISDNVKTIGSFAFTKCTGLETVVIGDGCTTLGGSAFYGCAKLVNLTLGAKVQYIGSYVFSNCYSLKNVVLSDVVTSLGSEVFNKCYALESVTIGNNVTTINKNMFYNCNKLKTITLGAKVNTVHYYAFVGCNALTDVYFNGTEAQKAKIAINSSNSKLKNATWHCNG